MAESYTIHYYTRPESDEILPGEEHIVSLAAGTTEDEAKRQAQLLIADNPLAAPIAHIYMTTPSMDKPLLVHVYDHRETAP